jgi:predicted CXXCH cytochrome family protein
MDHNRSISEKYSLDYYRHSLPTRSWKSAWNYVALVLALLAFAVMYLFGRNATFQAAPVASVHSSFGTNCSSCHDQSWGTGQRLRTFSSAPHSVSNTACQKCHRAAPHTAISMNEPACVTCHQEHRPQQRLIELTSSDCTQCHQNLRTASSSPVSFVTQIGHFEDGAGGHPEFAVLRSTPEPAGRNAAHLVAQFDPGKREWVDRGGLKFTHRLHLDPKRVLGPDRKPVRLGCSDCHVRGSDGYMQPIVYEQQCRKCHALKLVEPFSALGELPHSKVEEVRGVIRERLAKQIEQDSSKSSDTRQDVRLPRLPRPARLNMEQERELATKMKQVDHELFDSTSKIEQADHAIFGPEAKGACSKCHHVDDQKGEWRVRMTNPELPTDKLAASQDSAAEMIPSRWMRHAKFDHKSHRTINCSECHYAESSNQTSDILMPSISVCRTCHGSDASTSRPHVSADCVLCHAYHMENAAKESKGMSLEQLFRNSPAHTLDTTQ